MATSKQLKGFISDSEMESIEKSSPQIKTQKPAGFISDDEMSKIDNESKPKKLNSDSKQAALEGFGEGATLGYLNNIQAVLEKPAFAVMNKLTGQNVQADDYTQARDYYNRRQEKLKEESPNAFGAGQVAGTIVSSIPVARAAQGATVLARAAQGAKAGAIYGGLQNTAEKEGESGNLDIIERAQNAGFGAVTGAGASLGADALGKVGKTILSTKNKIGRSFKNTAEQLAENATGATRVQAEKYSDDAGRYLLDEGIVKFGDDAEKIASRANNAISKSESTIDSSLKSLDAKGVQISQDKIVEKIQSKIAELEKNSGEADVVRKLKTIVDDIINTGESNISATSAEQSKRSFNKMAKNWQDPEKGQAGKVAYRAYRDAVEETANIADESIATQFKNAKNSYGKLNPIADAAEKRARQLNQSPIGGLLDVSTGIAGGMASDDPMTGIASGIGMSLARRKIAPRISSSLAVAFDKVSKQLLKNPQTAELATKNPEAFKASVFGFIEKMGESNSFKPASTFGENTELKGYDKWAQNGANLLKEQGVDQNTIDKLQNSKTGRDLLIEASDSKPNSQRLNSVIKKIQTGFIDRGE